jgi:ABC-type lipoprotein export system ATPase subunit
MCRAAHGERGERLFVFGPSGSGKTTLLGLIAGVLRATPARSACSAPT